MKQLGLGLNLSTKKTRKREFLEEMERVVPWAVLVQIVEPHYPKAKTAGRRSASRPCCASTTCSSGSACRIRRWKRRCTTCRCTASSLDLTAQPRLPDETTILRFRHLLEKHDLATDMLRVVNDLLQRQGPDDATGTVVDATLISAPSSTKNAEGERDPEMRQTKKGNNWYFGMKAHIGVDTQSGLVHTVAGHGGQRQRRDAWPVRCCTARKKRPSATPATRACTSGLRRRTDLARGHAPGTAAQAQPVHRA
jgi:IS5 family transposase